MAKNKKRTTKAMREQEQNNREIVGICLIALGIFLGASIYSEAVGVVGSAISDFLFGICGLMGYAFPILLLICGILSIVMKKSTHRLSTFMMSLIAVIAILSIFHLCYRNSIAGVKIIDYYKDAYNFGTIYKLGGGLFGALLAYPSLLALGDFGSYVLFGAITVVMFLLITKISIKAAGEKLGKSIKSGMEVVAQLREKNEKLYTEDLSGVEVKKPTQPKKTKGTATKKIDFLMTEPISKASKKHKEVKNSRDLTLSVKDSELDLQFIPSMGSIKRKTVSEDTQVYAPRNNFDDEMEFVPFDQDEIIQGYENEDQKTVFMPPLETMENESDVRVSRITNYAPKTIAQVKQDDEAIQSDMPEIKTETKSNVAEDFKNDSDNVVIERVRPLHGTKKAETPPLVSINEKNVGEIQVYQRPPFSLMKLPDRTNVVSSESPTERGKLLVETLASFNISARIINISVGPVITRFELQPAQGVRVSRITSLSNDIALALAASRVRIEAPIPGKAAIGIEIPNRDKANVLLREVLETKEFQAMRSPIAFALGKDIAGKTLVSDLDKMPHLLIAGATGSGKSVCINCIMLSMAYKASPKDLRMILVDPKVVEMEMYAPLPHLLLPVVTDPKKAAGALKWAVIEMEKRYKKMAKARARDLARFNELQEDENEKMPKIVIVIDELADLMMVAAKDVEDSICRIAQLGRACGIHLIVATQRPSADIITGLIKANIPSRIAFMVSSAIDSRVILDSSGAEKLLGHGDMLFHANGAGKPVRAQGAFVSDQEVEAIMNFFTEQKSDTDDGNIDAIDIDEVVASSAKGATQGNGKQEDELLPEAVKIILDNGQASTSMLQRRLRVGYARASRLIDIMEQKKIVGGYEGSKPRKILIDFSDYERLFGASSQEGDDV